MDSGTDSGMDSGSDASDAMVDSGDAGNACTKNLTLNQNAGITSNHNHAFTIPMADFLGNANKTYTMNGQHTHNVTLTAANFATLRAGGTVNVTSTGGGAGNHTHACTIKCA